MAGSITKQYNRIVMRYSFTLSNFFEKEPLLSGKETKSGGIQVITRAASILRALGQANSGLSLGQLASRCSLPRSTVQRIIASLIDEGFVMHLGSNQGFTLGPEIQAFTATTRIQVWQKFHSYLASLANEIGETVDLAILQGDQVLFVDQIAGHHRLRAMSEPGVRFSAFTTDNGKACLSLLSDEKLKNELDVSDSLMVEIAQIRKSETAWDLGKHTEGISAVGAAFEDLNGQFYAISIPIPSQRFEKIKEQLAPKLLACISDIKKGKLCYPF